MQPIETCLFSQCDAGKRAPYLSPGTLQLTALSSHSRGQCFPSPLAIHKHVEDPELRLHLLPQLVRRHRIVYGEHGVRLHRVEQHSNEPFSRPSSSREDRVDSRGDVELQAPEENAPECERLFGGDVVDDSVREGNYEGGMTGRI